MKLLGPKKEVAYPLGNAVMVERTFVLPDAVKILPVQRQQQAKRAIWTIQPELGSPEARALQVAASIASRCPTEHAKQLCTILLLRSPATRMPANMPQRDPAVRGPAFSDSQRFGSDKQTVSAQLARQQQRAFLHGHRPKLHRQTCVESVHVPVVLFERGPRPSRVSQQAR